MSTSIRKGRRIWIVGHRGASGYAPENTMAAFRKAMELGSDMIELDVRQSRDGHLVVFHDQTLERTTDGDGPLHKWILAKLKELDAGSWFDVSYRGERIPTLDEVLQFARNRIGVCIDVKAEGVEEKVVALVERHRMERQVVIGLSEEVVRCVKEMNRNIGTIWVGVHNELSLGHCVDVVYSDLYINEAHEQGLPAWKLANTRERMRELIEIGIDGILSDFPDVALEVCTSQRAVEKEEWCHERPCGFSIPRPGSLKPDVI